ncbi:CHAP domain-containing protein [Arthrobacter pigmenti]
MPNPLILKKKLQLVAGLVIVVGLLGSMILATAAVLSIISGSTATSSAGRYEHCHAPGSTSDIPAAPEKIRKRQVKNAKIIDQVAAQLGLSGQASRIAIIAAYGESTLLNVGYGDARNGVTNPDGTLTSSLGLFQQQWRLGWGTKEQVMDPEYATRSFLAGRNHDGNGGLVSIDRWQQLEPTIAIHRVQRNADPTHYAKFYAAADHIIDLAGINVDRKRKAPLNQQETTAAAAQPQTLCGGNSSNVNGQQPNNDYPFRDITPPPGVYEVDPFGYYYGECTSFVAWRINKDAGSTKAPFKYSAANGNFNNGNAADWKDAWIARGWTVSHKPVPGAVAWWDSYGGPGIGHAGHVAYVADVTAEGHAIIEEYNNVGLAPPGHKYSLRPQPVPPDDVNMFLYPPPDNDTKKKKNS